MSQIGGIPTVYWRIKERRMHSYLVEFWTKRDKSNALTATMVVLDDEKLRSKVEHLTGRKHFGLVQSKD